MSPASQEPCVDLRKEECLSSLAVLLVPRTVRMKLKTVLFYQAELIKGDLDKAVKRGGSDLEPRREQPDIRYSVYMCAQIDERFIKGNWGSRGMTKTQIEQ